MNAAATIQVADNDGPPPVALVAGINGTDNQNRSLVSSLVMQFDKGVVVNSAASLSVMNLTNASPLNLSSAVLQNNGTNAVTWNLSTVHFSDGYYIAELLRSAATSVTGQSLAATYAFPFHVLVGDGTGDASVNFLDFAQVSRNFGAVVGPGDLDGSGSVNFGDFAVLSARFGATLGPAPELDYGDAPETETSYPTTLANNGARHVLGSGVYLGTGVDSEADGQANGTTTGDNDSSDDDENGVSFGSLQAGTTATVNVTAKVPSGLESVLSEWIDFNAADDWDDEGEQVFTDQELTDGVNTLAISVPPTAKVGTTFTRFRITSSEGYSYDGLATDGEVEDYQVAITAPLSSLLGIRLPRRSIPAEPTALTEQADSSNRRFTSSSSFPVPLATTALDQAILQLTSTEVRPRRELFVWLDEKLVDEVFTTRLIPWRNG